MTPRFIPSCTDELMCKLKRYSGKISDSGAVSSFRKLWRNFIQELCPKSEFMGTHMISLDCLEETARQLWLIAYIQTREKLKNEGEWCVYRTLSGI